MTTTKQIRPGDNRGGRKAFDGAGTSVAGRTPRGSITGLVRLDLGRMEPEDARRALHWLEMVRDGTRVEIVIRDGQLWTLEALTVIRRAAARLDVTIAGSDPQTVSAWLEAVGGR